MINGSSVNMPRNPFNTEMLQRILYVTHKQSYDTAAIYGLDLRWEVGLLSNFRKQ